MMFLLRRLAVVIELLFDLLHDDGDDEIEDIVEHTRDDERNHGGLRVGDLLGDGEHFHDGDDLRKRRVFHECDDFIGDRGDDPLDDLWEDDFEERLAFGVAENGCGFILSDGNGGDAATVDFREIGGVVQDEGNDDGDERRVVFQRPAENIIRAEIDDQQLKHERRAAHDGNIDSRYVIENRIFGHPHQCYKEAEGEGEKQRQEEDVDGSQKAGGQLQ